MQGCTQLERLYSTVDAYTQQRNSTLVGETLTAAPCLILLECRGIVHKPRTGHFCGQNIGRTARYSLTGAAA